MLTVVPTGLAMITDAIVFEGREVAELGRYRTTRGYPDRWKIDSMVGPGTIPVADRQDGLRLIAQHPDLILTRFGIPVPPTEGGGNLTERLRESSGG